MRLFLLYLLQTVGQALQVRSHALHARLHIGLERPEIGHDLLLLRNGLQLIRGHRGKNQRKGLTLSREAFHKQFAVRARKKADDGRARTSFCSSLPARPPHHCLTHISLLPHNHINTPHTSPARQGAPSLPRILLCSCIQLPTISSKGKDDSGTLATLLLRKILR